MDQYSEENLAVKLASHKQLATHFIADENGANIYKIVTFPNELCLVLLTEHHPFIPAISASSANAIEYCQPKHLQTTIQEGALKYTIFLCF